MKPSKKLIEQFERGIELVEAAPFVMGSQHPIQLTEDMQIILSRVEVAGLKIGMAYKLSEAIMVGFKLDSSDVFEIYPEKVTPPNDG